MIDRLFETALCAVGGARGGAVVPRWFPALARLGVQYVYLFWAMPGGPEEKNALECLRSEARLWLEGLRALGIAGELLMKRGNPGPWLSALAGILNADLIVAGPPSIRGGPSRTLEDLLQSSPASLLLLPDSDAAPGTDLLARPIVATDQTPAACTLLGAWTAGRPVQYVPAAGELAAGDLARKAVRFGVEAAATSLLLAGRRAAELAPRIIAYGSLPLLIPPPHPRPIARNGSTH